MFEPSESLYLQLNITDMEDKEYTVTEYILNRQNGSLYDEWVKMGCQDPNSDMEYRFLEYKSVPAIHKSKLTAKDGILTLCPQLSLLEV